MDFTPHRHRLVRDNVFRHTESGVRTDPFVLSDYIDRGSLVTNYVSPQLGHVHLAVNGDNVQLVTSWSRIKDEGQTPTRGDRHCDIPFQQPTRTWFENRLRP